MASNVLEKERTDRMSIYRVIYVRCGGVYFRAAMSIDRIEIASSIGIVQLTQLFCSGGTNFCPQISIYIYIHTHAHISDSQRSLSMSIHVSFHS